MSNARFGLYFIPEVSVFYRTGSKITGYDIRAQQATPSMEAIKPEWQSVSGEFGFHVTVTDAIDIDSERLPEIAKRVRQLLACFKEGNQYVCTRRSVGFWNDSSPYAALVLTPNRPVEMLHDVLVSVIHPLGSGSAYTGRLKGQPETYFPDSPSNIAKTEQFSAPYIFDNFIPHFTCINPFTGSYEERQGVEATLKEMFAGFESIEFHSLALVAKAVDESHFRIVEEFSLHGQR